MKRAKILVIEGTDGSGKETQSKKLYEHLKEKGLKVKSYSFPIYSSSTGKIVGGPYLGKKEIGDSYFEETSANVDPLVSSIYYAADRRYNFLKEIEDEIYKNDIIILDRYIMSNMGHQAGKAKTKKDRDKILKFIEILEFELCELPRPDKVIFLHMPFEAAKELRKDRVAGDGNENSESHLRNAEKNYLDIAKMYNWHCINCIKGKKYNNLNDIKSIDEIALEISNVVDTLLEEKSVHIKKMTRF
ncbi:MAG: deoxynucleoside kinase [Bacilli bacterium]|nr:deoxynucleoside kinase [Bacilli bacterium]